MSANTKPTPKTPIEFSHLEEVLRLRRRVADLEWHVEALWKLSRVHFHRLGGEDELGPYDDPNES